MDAQQLTEELSLRALNSLHTLIMDHERGLITKGQVATGAKAVFDTVSSIIQGDVLQVVSAVAKEFKDKGYEIDLVKKNGKLMGTIRVCGKGSVLAFKARPLYKAGYDVDEPDLAARKRSDHFMEGLIKA